VRVCPITHQRCECMAPVCILRDAVGLRATASPPSVPAGDETCAIDRLKAEFPADDELGPALWSIGLSVSWWRLIGVEIDRLRTENAELKNKLSDAVDSIETWAAYADEYFQAKWGLRDELAGYRAFLSRLQGVTDNAG
jgi:hypothetical protein